MAGECSATTNVGVGLPFPPVFLSPPPAAQTRAPVTRQLYARRKTQLDLVWKSRSEQVVLTTRLPGPVPGFRDQLHGRAEAPDPMHLVPGWRIA